MTLAWRWHHLCVCVCLFICHILRKGGRTVEQCFRWHHLLPSLTSPLSPPLSLRTPSIPLRPCLWILFCLLVNILLLRWISIPVSPLALHIPRFPRTLCLLSLSVDFTPTTNFVSPLFYIPSLTVIFCCFSFSLCVVGHQCCPLLFSVCLGKLAEVGVFISLGAEMLMMV